MAHTAKILLLGSGELGREFVISAKRLGACVIACDAYDNAPAMQLADAREVFSMLDGETARALHQTTFNLGALEEMSKGQYIADLVAIIGSIDIVLGEVDR